MIKLLVTLVLAIFIVAVGIAMFSMTEKGQKIYQKMNDKENAKIMFPVFIGNNGIDFRDDLIENAFEGIGRYYEIFYFLDVVWLCPYVITYQFKVHEPIHKEMSNSRRLSCVRNISEKALKHHFNLRGWYYPVDNLIAVSLQGDVLNIMIATGTLGLPEIKRLRKLPK